MYKNKTGSNNERVDIVVAVAADTADKNIIIFIFIALLCLATINMQLHAYIAFWSLEPVEPFSASFRANRVYKLCVLLIKLPIYDGIGINKINTKKMSIVINSALYAGTRLLHRCL